MIDVYVRDTTEALDKADAVFANILPSLNYEYSDKWNTLCMEVEGLLEQYNNLLVERDDLLVKIEELEEEKE